MPEIILMRVGAMRAVRQCSRQWTDSENYCVFPDLCMLLVELERVGEDELDIVCEVDGCLILLTLQAFLLREFSKSHG